jgi:hypothetical protein
MAHRQHVPFGRVLNVPRDSIPADQPERAFLFPLLLQGFPKLRNLRFKAGLCKVIDPAADDLLPRKPQELAHAGAGFPGIALIVGEEDGYGGMIDNRPEKELKFSWAVLYKPAGGW